MISFIIFLFFLLLLVLSGGMIGLAVWLFRTPDSLSRLHSFVKRSTAVRFAAVFALILSLLLPLMMIGGLVDERASYYRSVTNEIANLWAGKQTVQMAVLTVPYTYEAEVEEKVKDKDGEERFVKRIKVFRGTYFLLPDTLDLKADMKPQTRKRGIYEAVVYESAMNAEMTFGAPDFSELDVTPKTVLWEQARLNFGISETRGISEGVRLEINKSVAGLMPGTNDAEFFLGAGFHAKVGQVASGGMNVTLKLPVRGSQVLYFAPFGKDTRIALSSTWASPRFSGAFLPAEREISADGFTAAWSVPHLARSFPQAWTSQTAPRKKQFSAFIFGVGLIEPVWLYAQTGRAVKYALLLIGLTFFAVLLLERGLGIRFHLIQYVVIAISLSLVYLLILSLGEHLGFAKAYAAATGIVVLMTCAYAQASLRSKIMTGWLFVSLSSLFTALYTILSLEDYALLAGSLLLVLALAALMIATKGLAKERDDLAVSAPV